MRKFWKMHGAGNDFVLLDCRDDVFVGDRVALCDRHFGIGCDQLIEVHHSVDENDFLIKFFNQDGSETGACGNGTRCVAAWLFQQVSSDSLRLSIGQRVLDIQQIDGSIWVNMRTASWTAAKIPMLPDAYENISDFLDLDNSINAVGVCSMGNPHLVLMGNAAFSDEYIQQQGARLTKHKAFPEQVNIGFAYIQNNDIKLRVYERGVGETYACGSGACAAFSIARRLGLWKDDDMFVQMLGGTLQLRLQGNEILMTGPVAFVAEGIWHG